MRRGAARAGEALRQVAGAVAAQGGPRSGLPGQVPGRDVIGETALNLALAKRPQTPAMVLASLALSPLMPWAAQTGRDLAESLMGGDFRGAILTDTPAHKELWDDIRASAGSLPQLRFLLDRICERIGKGDQVRARLTVPPGEGTPDWEIILRGIQIAPPMVADPDRNLEGVSLWSAHESPWRPCRHLIVSDFTDGLYPTRPRANPLFLDSEIAAIHARTGVHLRGRAEGLAQSLALPDQQPQAVSGSVTFLIPWRDLAGGRLQLSAGLSLVARAMAGVEDASDLITDLSRQSPAEWPIAYHQLMPVPEPAELPVELAFPGHDLLSLRRRDDGTSKPQSPSRLETLLVSPLAWLLAEVGAEDMSWSTEELDVMARGNIAHDVFEHVFLKDQPFPETEALVELISEAYDRAITRHAGYLRSPSWEMERRGLEREIMAAALRWRDHLLALNAKIIGNEIWLAGEARGINLHGTADALLALPDSALLILDPQKRGPQGRPGGAMAPPPGPPHQVRMRQRGPCAARLGRREYPGKLRGGVLSAHRHRVVAKTCRRRGTRRAVAFVRHAGCRETNGVGVHAIGKAGIAQHVGDVARVDTAGKKQRRRLRGTTADAVVEDPTQASPSLVIEQFRSRHGKRRPISTHVGTAPAPDIQCMGRGKRSRTRFQGPSGAGGAEGRGVRGTPEREKASNRMGAAVAYPARPGAAPLSGRPTQTPSTGRPS